MEKLIYLVWRDTQETLREILRAQLAPQLLAAGARNLRFNIADAAVAPAVKITQTVLQPAAEGLVQLWVDSAVHHLREPIDAALAACGLRSAGYLVSESAPIVNRLHPPQPGQRTEGFAQIALLRRPARLTVEQWLDVWQQHHTRVAVETQTNFEYVQNYVVRKLTPEAPELTAIVEECFPAAAMTDPYVFFDAVGDETKFKRNLDRMMDSVGRFIDPGTIDVIPTSQYIM